MEVHEPESVTLPQWYQRNNYAYAVLAKVGGQQRNSTMALSIVSSNLFLKKLVEKTYNHILGGVRCKVGPGRNSNPKHYGVWVQNGAIVKRGTNLARQFHLRFCAGLNVGYMNGFLYAKVPGRVVVTTETTNFDSNSHWVQRLSANHTVMSMKYFNVIPEPQHCRFKLVDTN